MENKFIVLFISFAVVLLGMTSDPKSSRPINHRNEVIVEMVGTRFVPKHIKIRKGQVLTFINRSSMRHNVVFPLLKKRSTLLSKGKKFSFTFNKLGEFNYYCTPHRTMGMVGTIEVTDGKNKFRNTRINRVRNKVQNHR